MHFSSRSTVVHILVILTCFGVLELCESCHRRVEYHHYKRPPPPHHGKGHGQGHHGGGSYGHYKGGYHMKGHGHGGEGHGGGYHRGHGHHEQKGYGNDPYDHGGGGHYHMGEEHGGHGHDDGYYSMGPEYHRGHTGGGYNQGHEPGYHGGSHGGPHNNAGMKGRKYRYHMYESTHYDDKDGYNHQRPSHGHGQSHHQSLGYSQNVPHYMKKGYGHSGPYPNTEYSTPVETAVIVPSSPDHISYDEEDVGGLRGTAGVTSNRYPLQLDAADTADLIRNSFDSKENEIMAHSLGSFAGGLEDSRGSNSDFSSPEVVPTPAVNFQVVHAPLQHSSSTSQVDPSIGNFDLNLEFNSPDLPVPFKRNFFDSVAVSQRKEGGVLRGRKRKKLSSKYRNEQLVDGADKLPDVEPVSEDRGTGTTSNIRNLRISRPKPLQVLKGGSDYLENDAVSTGTQATGTGDDKNADFPVPEFMNF